MSSLDELATATATANRRRGPWSSEQLTTAVVGNAVGAASIASAWVMSANSASDGTGVRLSWFTLAVAGLAAAGFSNALWLLRGRRMLTLARSSIVSMARHQRAASAVGTTTRTMTVRLAGSSLYHVPDCVLVVGKQVSTVDSAQVADDGLTACGACEP